MLIYFDLCALQRQHDDQSQVRVRVETVAVLGLLDHCWAGLAGLASSETLVYENGRNTLPVRQAQTDAVLRLAIQYQPTTPAVRQRANVLTAAGLGLYDAYHLASAEAVGADRLCTCDDRFLRKGRPLAVSPLRMVSPTELVTELGI